MSFLSRSAIVSFLLLIVASASQAEMYTWVDEKGRVHYSDTAPENNHSVKQVELKQLNTIQAVSVEDNPFAESYQNDKQRRPKVVMYSTEWCGVCKKAKSFFLKNNIPFREYDVEKTKKGQRDYQRLNGKGVPVILVGKQRMNGFSAKRFMHMYRS